MYILHTFYMKSIFSSLNFFLREVSVVRSKFTFYLDGPHQIIRVTFPHVSIGRIIFVNNPKVNSIAVPGSVLRMTSPTSHVYVIRVSRARGQFAVRVSPPHWIVKTVRVWEVKSLKVFSVDHFEWVRAGTSGRRQTHGNSTSAGVCCGGLSWAHTCSPRAHAHTHGFYLVTDKTWGKWKDVSEPGLVVSKPESPNMCLSCTTRVYSQVSSIYSNRCACSSIYGHVIGL